MVTDTRARRAMPGVDDDGFAPLEVLRNRLAMSRTSFLQIYDTPALLVERASGPNAARETPTESVAAAVADASKATAGGGDTASRPTVMVMSDDARVRDDDATIRRYSNRVALISKRPGNPFANMFNIGRSVQCDITIVLGSVSKMHGYFLLENGEWTFTDHRSTNGTRVNGVKIPTATKTVVRSGDTIRFGLGLECRFLLPEHLADRLA